MAAWILACVAGCNWRQPGLGFAAALALVAEGARVLLSAPHEATAATAVARLTQDAAPGPAAIRSPTGRGAALKDADNGIEREADRSQPGEHPCEYEHI